MRGLSLVDVLVVLAVLGVLVYASTRDFNRYAGQTVAPVPTATATPLPAS